jgi:hypothetical protein
VIKKVLLIVCLFISLNFIANAQVYDVVSIGAGYPNQAFYSLANGEVSNVSNTDWDLAFQITGFQATILVNGKNNVRLFKSDLDINSWSTITAADTVGKLDPAHELYNQDTSWWAGAFNITNDQANMFDLGWGVYDLATHAVTGDSLYFLKLANGTVKKLWVQSLANNIYSFAYADIDGTNEVNTSLNKQNYTGKNFGFYSIQNGMELDREPNKYTWDLSFAQYMATTPFIYKVTGILSNDSVSAVKAYPVDVATVSPWLYGFSNYINTIGYDWKTYDFNTNSWIIADSTVYFVVDRNGSLWKMIFTGFGGSANGNFEFSKEQISATGIPANGAQPAILGIFPNPASGTANITLYIDKYSDANVAGIYDLNGREVTSFNLKDQSGLVNIPVNTSSLNAGLYFIRTIIDGSVSTEKLIIAQ